MADVDLAKCEQPDELMQVAWDAGYDKNAVIRAGSDGARLLTAQRNEMRSLFWPVPLPLEPVDRWSGNSNPASDAHQSLRPYASAVVPGCIVGALLSHFLVAPHLSKNSGILALLAILLASIALLGVVFKILIESSIQRHAAALDEDRAFSIVLAELRRGMARRSALVPIAVKGMREYLAATK